MQLPATATSEGPRDTDQLRDRLATGHAVQRPYALTKHAIEAYGDALRRELSHVGIPVTIIQPGPFRTTMTGSIGDQIELSPA
ncbi:hypothetical protein MAHJHV65_20050 [Mycobacterium avium subsp. hominissuis]